MTVDELIDERITSAVALIHRTDSYASGHKSSMTLVIDEVLSIAGSELLLALVLIQRERLALQRASNEKMSGLVDSLSGAAERLGIMMPPDVTTTVNPGVGSPPKAADPPADNGAGPA